MDILGQLAESVRFNELSQSLESSESMKLTPIKSY